MSRKRKLLTAADPIGASPYSVGVAGLALRACAVCGRIASRGSYCPEHERTRRARRGTTAERGYGNKHRRRALAAIASHPWCSDCGATHTPENPLSADHVVPIAHGGVDGPLEVRCRRCNSSRGATVRRR
jgi:5-methylcytosine-specific restriction enzyme A